MNVYDFDGTLYDGDSSADFVLYCLRRYPRLLRYAPEMAKAYRRYRRGELDKTHFKEHLFHFVEALPELPQVVARFWETHIRKVYPWYAELHRATDVIVSASPAFLEEPLRELLQVECVIASRIDPQSGKFDGINCRNAEKVRRFREVYPESVIDRAYGNSDGDYELACEAGEAFLVKKGRPEPWDVQAWKG